MPRFAANLTLMFTELPFAERFAASARAGFSAVEFLFPYEHAPVEVAGWLRENALHNVLFNAYPGDYAAGERGLAALPGREAEFRAALERTLEYALALETPTIHVMAGLVPDGADRQAYLDTFVENLRYAAAVFGRHRKTVVIEPLNTRDVPGYLFSRQAEAHAICRAVGAPNLKVQMDFYHAQIMEGDLSTTFRRHFDGIGHLQIAGVPDRHEPDEGEVSYRHLFALIDALGYAGYVGCEYRPRGRTEDGLGWLRALTA